MKIFYTRFYPVATGFHIPQVHESIHDTFYKLQMYYYLDIFSRHLVCNNVRSDSLHIRELNYELFNYLLLGRAAGGGNHFDTSKHPLDSKV